jgi:hypothetical protein
MRGSINFESEGVSRLGVMEGDLTWVLSEGAYVKGEYDILVINMLRYVISHVTYLRSSKYALLFSLG